MVATTHQCKDPNNHYNIYDHTKQKCWKFHPKLNLKNKKKENKKTNLMATDLSNQVDTPYMWMRTLFVCQCRRR